MSAPSTKYAAAIAALLAGQTQEQAAKTAKIGSATLRRWQADPAFTAELAAARREAIERVLDIFVVAGRHAAGQLVQLSQPGVPPGVRLRASIAILDRLSQWVELSDLDARLRALEGRTNES